MHRHPSRLAPSLLATVACVALPIPPALAAAGVLEINQTCALQTGCFAGDTPGFPVTINGTAGRNVRLTSDITIPNENTTALLVVADQISIDLAGFAIRGPVTCSGLPTTCSPTAGTGAGVDASLRSGARIFGGTVSGMGFVGILSGGEATVSDVHALSNRLGGINLGASSILERATTTRNGGTGINALSASGTIKSSVATSNGQSGITVGLGVSVIGNAVYQNGGVGINAASGSNVSDNSVYDNLGSGITVTSGVNVSRNAVSSNSGDGITASNGSLLQGNTVSFNGGVGLSLSAGASYRENNVLSNVGGTVTGGINGGNNACNSTAVCP